MPHELTIALEWVVYAINIVTVIVLVWGVARGFVQFVACELHRVGSAERAARQQRLRRHVGFYLLFGLELLIAADVIETMIKPSLEQLAILAGVSAIRIITGYALGQELKEEEISHG